MTFDDTRPKLLQGTLICALKVVRLEQRTEIEDLVLPDRDDVSNLVQVEQNTSSVVRAATRHAMLCAISLPPPSLFWFLSALLHWTW